jgi:uncharacterized protein (DUF305 family)
MPSAENSPIAGETEVEVVSASSTATRPPVSPVRGTVPPSSILTRWGSRGTALVLGLAALVMVLIGATIGLAVGRSGPQTISISDEGKDPVDTGFARDMVYHHQQGVDMAHIAELNSTDETVRTRAYDIEYTQTSEIGTMNGWLDMWQVPRLTLEPRMTWMGSAGMADMNTGATATTSAAASTLMPGMATPQEMAKLETLRGRASDIYFLQLMIRHHQGGAVMMAYAANHAASSVVRNFASKMLDAQTSEIGVMTGMLDDLGHAKPLPYTGPTA